MPLALVAYEALTGVNPVQTGTAAMRARRLGAHLPPLRRQRRDLPRELGAGIDLALRPRARERGTLEELRQALLVSLDQAEDTPGIVTGPWPGAAGAQTAPGDVDPVFLSAYPDREPPPLRFSAAGERAEPESEPVSEPARDWRTRGLAALVAAVSSGWLTAHLLTPSSAAPPPRRWSPPRSCWRFRASAG